MTQKNRASFVRFLSSLDDPKCRQITTVKDGSPVLKSKSEILFNAMGRFMQLRGFVDEKHELTSWGKALQKAFLSLDASEKHEDSIYLAFEMLRLGMLDDKHFVLGSTRSKAGMILPLYL
jgi:Temperature dependent protein affecting M2 dsRNA replication